MHGCIHKTQRTLTAFSVIHIDETSGPTSGRKSARRVCHGGLGMRAPSPLSWAPPRTRARTPISITLRGCIT